MIFDEQEQPNRFRSVPGLAAAADPNVIVPFPAETQSVHVGGAALPVPYDFGWLYLNLNTTIPAAARSAVGSGGGSGLGGRRA